MIVQYDRRTPVVRVRVSLPLACAHDDAVSPAKAGLHGRCSSDATLTQGFPRFSKQYSTSTPTDLQSRSSTLSTAASEAEIDAVLQVPSTPQVDESWCSLEVRRPRPDPVATDFSNSSHLWSAQGSRQMPSARRKAAGMIRFLRA